MNLKKHSLAVALGIAVLAVAAVLVFFNLSGASVQESARDLGHDSQAPEPMGGRMMGRETGKMGTDNRMRQGTAGETFIPYNAEQALPAKNTEHVKLADGQTFLLEAGVIKKELGGKPFYLYAYNRQVPGPILEVEQGSKLSVEFKNELGQPTTVHWHGLRLKNENDGVPGVTQEEVKPGETFRYELEFPDEGAYWYHPHAREELQQELGLYGVILVEPKNTVYYNAVNREEVLVLDDLLLKEGELYPFFKSTTNFAAMGRYGNQPFVNGEFQYRLSLKKGEVVRFYLLNAANVRPFQFAIEELKLKVVGGDSGKYAEEFLADDVTIAPSERYIAEVQFEKPGKYRILNRNPVEEHVLGEITVTEEETEKAFSFSEPKENEEIVEGMEAFRKYFGQPVDFEYVLTIDIPGAMPMDMMMEHGEDGIEWEDSMFGMNRISTNESLTWLLKDPKTGKKNMDIKHQVKKGQVFKIRLENEEDSLHPMQHPIHLHGARFLVLETDGNKNENLVWKDTVLVPIGRSVELLTYFPNEGEWMLHCHIAEHLGSGMMASIEAA